MGFGDAGDRGQPLDGPGLVGGGIHAVFGAQQAAQQGGGHGFDGGGRERSSVGAGRESD